MLSGEKAGTRRWSSDKISCLSCKYYYPALLVFHVLDFYLLIFSVYFLFEINLYGLFKQNSDGFVRRIRDEDIETEEELVQFSNGHGETSSSNPKLRWCQVDVCVVVIDFSIMSC